MVTPDRRAPRRPLVYVAWAIEQASDRAHHERQANAAHHLKLAAAKRRNETARVSLDTLLKWGERTL